MDADERQDDATGRARRIASVDTPAEEQVWDEAMHQAASLARAQGNAPGAVEETIRQAHRSILDWRPLLRRYMTDAARREYSWSVPNRRFIDSGLYLPSMHSEGIDAIAIIIDTSGSLPGEDVDPVLGRGSRNRRRTATGQHLCPSGRRGAAGRRPSIPPGTFRTASRSRAGAGPIFGQASQWLHEHGVYPNCCLYLTDMECDSYPETEPPYPVAWVRLGAPAGRSRIRRALGRAHRHRTGLIPRAAPA